MNIVGDETLPVSSTAIALQSAPDTAKRMFISCEDDDVRWRASGSDPTSSIGHPIKADDHASFTGSNYRQLIENIKFIRVTTDASLTITYFD